jgi:hypothetical protein
LLGSEATLSPNDRQSGDADMPKPRRSRAQLLTRVDRRLPLGRRITELTRVFTDALAGAGELSSLRKLKIEQAAQASAVAELARGRYLRDGQGDLADLITAERHAAAAVRLIGLPKERTKPLMASVADILARVNKGASP